ATADATEWTGAWTTFASLEKGWAYRQDQLPSTHPIVAEIADLEDVEVNFDGITYAKAPRCSNSSWPGWARSSSSPACVPTSASTPGATPSCPICSPNWRPPAGGT